MHPRRALTAVAAALLLTCCASRGAADEAAGQVTGRVLSAPSCPVERVEDPCPPRPVAGAAVVAYLAGHRRAATTSDQAGVFSLSLPAGHYRVQATNPGAYASEVSQEVDVSVGVVRITLTVDSGIR